MLMLESLIQKLSVLGANFERLDAAAREFVYSLSTKVSS
jgi:hypothetical protein